MRFKYTFLIVILVNCQFSSAIVTNKTNNFFDLLLTGSEQGDGYLLNSNTCTSRLHMGLEKLRKRQPHIKSTAFIDLSGYALHQTLRHLPLDMYVTDIKVRTPGIGDWIRVEKCQFSNRDNKMTAQILFNDLTVLGTVQLLDDSKFLKDTPYPIPREFCQMSLRLQRAGLGINAFPTNGRSRGLDVKTEARFLDPKFLSVHAYGCKLSDIFKKRENLNKGNLETLNVETNNEANSAEKYMESQVQDRLRLASNYTAPGFNSNHDYGHAPHLKYENSAESEREKPEVRIVTLNPGTRTNDDSTKWFSLHRDQESNLNDFHRRKVLGARLYAPTEKEKLQAILHVQNLIAQQANHVFQTQGPFSQLHKPIFKPYKPLFSKPKPFKDHTVISSIMELDENLSPIRPIPQRPFEALFTQNDQFQAHTNDLEFQNYYEIVSREMEDVFLRGIKTLLTRFIEKQLELPLKEALMVNIGYTVSYG